MMPVKPREVVNFIRQDFRELIRMDFCEYPFRIFREHDLHASCYFHLRQFLDSDPTWGILNEPLLRELKGDNRSARPDIVITRNGRLQYLLEIKFRQKHAGIGKKDRLVLKRAVKYRKWAKQAFYIETVVNPKHLSNGNLVPRRNKEICIPMPEECRDEYLRFFKNSRKPLPRSKMLKYNKYGGQQR